MTNTIELADILICDDIREEHDGRFSLMGLYPGKEITVQQLPTVINQLVFVLRFKGLSEEPLPLHVAIFAPDKQESRPVQGRPLTPQDKAGHGLFILSAAPLQISEVGTHSLRIRLGKKTFQSEFTIVKPSIKTDNE